MEIALLGFSLGLFLMILVFINPILVLKKQIKKNIYLNTTYYTAAEFFKMLVFLLGVNALILVFLLINYFLIKTIDVTKKPAGDIIFYVNLIILILMLITFLILNFVVKVFKQKFAKNKNYVINLSIEEVLDFDTSKYNYNFKDLTYTTAQNKERKFSKLITSLENASKMSGNNMYKWRVFWILANIPIMKTNFHFANDKDKICWIFNKTLNELFTKNVLNKDQEQKRFTRLSEKYKADIN
ncbi:hypothetical protein ACW95P_03625 [Candidatus Mycoplasma pogonae]